MLKGRMLIWHRIVIVTVFIGSFCGVAAQGLPDLVVDDIWTTPSQLVLGQTFTFHAQIRNQGDTAASWGPFFFEAIEFRDFMGRLGGDRYYDVLLPGQFTTISITSTARFFGVRQYYAEVDPGGHVDESNEVNNTRSEDWRVYAPDLMVINLWTIPASPTSGASFTMYATVWNRGDYPSGPAFVGFLLDDELLGEQGHNALGPDQTVTVSRAFTAPAADSYTAKAQADNSGDVVEEYESNNDRQLAVTVQSAPNSAPSAPVLTNPTNGAAGQSRTPTLQASAFSDPDADAHANSHWQVSSAANFSAVVWDGGSTNGPSTEANVPAGRLLYNTMYYWRVRYQDDRGAWSAWAASRYFVTESAIGVSPSDYDGDGSSDLVVFDTIGGYWYIRTLAGGVIAWKNQWGWSTAFPVPGDYNGDGKWDMAVFDTVGGYWYIKNVSGKVITWKNQWGWSTARPVPGDYNGDGKWDMAVFDTVGGYWYIKNVSGKAITWKNQWGWSTAFPVPGDYDGDGKWDQAVFDTVGGYWYIKSVSGKVITWKHQWGWSTAIPVPGDYDGDGVHDLAVYDTQSGKWYIKTLDGRVLAWGTTWGGVGVVPVAGDYDGDGIADLGVYDQSTGMWHVRKLTGQILAEGVQWGWSTARVPRLGE